ncbi:MAG: hypothetical protein HC881_10725 [Leptolyngbyaceae cyanobacterium SL_7_1]|nr:hypothetical protein [Leptolyngbyaceae cyanobacterium SL_7_1]
MVISDLNYLEVANEANVTGGGKRSRGVTVNTNKYIRVDIKKDVASKVDIKGNLADAEAVADAYGYNSLAETYTESYATYYSSSAYSSSVSAVD